MMDEKEIFVGRSFESFEHLEEFIQKYELANKQKFWVRSSRSVEAAKKVLRRPLSEKIKYYELQYSCVHGGLEFKTRGKGIRRKSTSKMDCPAKIKLRATQDGKSLEIRSFVLKHQGHETIESKKRKVVKRYSSAQNNVSCPLTSEDNEGDNSDDDGKIGYPGIRPDPDIEKEISRQDDILKAMGLLKDEHGASALVLYSEEGDFKGLYFTSNEMQKSLLAWPELVYIWSVYNWLSSYTLVFISIKDPNGFTNIVAVGLLSEDDKDSLTWILQKFKSDVCAANLQIQFIMAEKHLVEGQLKEIFIESTSYVSVYYSLKLFQRIINSENFMITKKERDHCMDLFTKMVYAKTSSQYDIVYGTFSRQAPKCVVDYFNEDWEPNKNDWCFFNMEKGTMVDINGKCETLDNRIKQVIQKNSTFYAFVKQFFKWMTVQSIDRKHKLKKQMIEKCVEEDGEIVSCHAEYYNYLTNYAFNYVLHQYELIPNVSILEEMNEGVYITQEDTILYPATINYCECKEYESMLLPCRHILAVRKHLGLSFFDKELCGERWKKDDYYRKRMTIDGKLDKVKLSDDQKRQASISLPPRQETTDKAVNLTNQLLDLISTENEDGRLQKKLSLLTDIISLWNRGYDVRISQTVKPDKEIENIDINNGLKCDEERVLPKPSLTRKIMRFDLNQYKSRNVPLKFGLKTPNEKIRLMLSWIADINIVDKVFEENYIVTINDIENEPKHIPHSILHESVDLQLLQTFMTPPAFSRVVETVNVKRENENWLCYICECTLDEESVLCASCLLWFHPKCVGLPNPQKRKTWFCYNCTNKSLQ